MLQVTTELRLRRRWLSTSSTIGELLRPDGSMLSFTLEDACPDPYVNAPGKTCIPAGRYQVIRADSKRFAPRRMLRLLNVPGRQGILIHEGNTEVDVIGCIAVGQARMVDRILHSVDALKAVDEAVDAYLAQGVVWLTVTVDSQPIC